jgi:hypothetical protein
MLNGQSFYHIASKKKHVQRFKAAQILESWNIPIHENFNFHSDLCNYFSYFVC